MEKLAQKQHQNANKAIHASRNAGRSSGQNGSKNGVNKSDAGNGIQTNGGANTLSSNQLNGQSQMSSYDQLNASFDPYNGGNGGNYASNYDQFASPREFQEPAARLESTLPFAKRLRSSSGSGGFASMAMFFPDEFPGNPSSIMNYDEFALGSSLSRRKGNGDNCEVVDSMDLSNSRDRVDSSSSPGGSLEKSRYVEYFKLC